MANKKELVVVYSIDRFIIEIRGHRVILDSDLARLYGISTKAFNQAVKRNAGRFPADFTFQLTRFEKSEVVTNCDHLAQLRYSSALPYAFTEHGALMAANVLNSSRAIEVSVFVVRAFLKLRTFVAANQELARKLSELERKVDRHDESIRTLLAAIRQLASPPPNLEPRRRIGFRPGGLER
jgi:hypothetical protein